MGKFYFGTNTASPLIVTRLVNNQDITVTNNGTYTATSGYSGLGTVIVNVQSSVFNTETLVVSPSTTSQTFYPSVDGYSQVTVNAVTNAIDANIIPENIRQGVSVLNVAGSFAGVTPTGTLTINENGTYNVYNYANATVNVQAALSTKNITENGTYVAGQDSLDGYSSVFVNVPSGGGSGHTLTIQTTGNAQLLISLSENGNTFYTTRGCTHTGSSDTSVFKNIESFSISCSSWEPGSYCEGTLTMGGSSTSCSINTTYTLTGDATLQLIDKMCLTGDTIVLMADGSEKRLDMIELGDMVLSFNAETLELEPDEVIFTDKDETKIGDGYDLWTFENNYYVKTVHKHRFYNVEREACVYMDEWNIGEHTLTKDLNSVALLHHEFVKGDVRHFKITTKKWHNYFANGMLTGSRLTPEMKLKRIIK